LSHVIITETDDLENVDFGYAEEYTGELGDNL